MFLIWEGAWFNHLSASKKRKRDYNKNWVKYTESVAGMQIFLPSILLLLGLPRWLSGKEFASHAGDAGDVDLIPALGRYPGGGHGKPLQYSCLENSMDRGLEGLQLLPKGRHKESDITEPQHTQNMYFLKHPGLILNFTQLDLTY